MNTGIEKKVGHNLKTLREAAGYTQEYIATKLQLCGCDMTRSAYAKMEVGQRHIYVDEVMLLKRILKVGYSQILDIELDD